MLFLQKPLSNTGIVIQQVNKWENFLTGIIIKIKIQGVDMGRLVLGLALGIWGGFSD